MNKDISSPNNSPSEPPQEKCKFLHHYTDTGGLLDIVQSRAIRASDVWYMNDVGEALYGWVTLKKAIDSITPEPGNESAVYSEVQKILVSRDPDTIVHSYIACLSKECDQLSQWRAYGRSTGVSIGFNAQQLQRICGSKQWIGKPFLRDVTYDVDQQNKMVRDEFAKVIRTWRGPLGSSIPGSPPPRSTAVKFILEAMAITVPAFKDSAFEEEQEVRLQILHDAMQGIPENIRFRNGRMGLTPYIDISLEDPRSKQIACISEIVIGPQPHQDGAVRAVRQMLSHYSIQDVEIRKSEIPLRP